MEPVVSNNTKSPPNEGRWWNPGTVIEPMVSPFKCVCSGRMSWNYAALRTRFEKGLQASALQSSVMFHESMKLYDDGNGGLSKDECKSVTMSDDIDPKVIAEVLVEPPTRRLMLEHSGVPSNVVRK